MKKPKRSEVLAWAVVGTWKGRRGIPLSSINYRKEHAAHTMRSLNYSNMEVVRVSITEIRPRGKGR